MIEQWIVTNPWQATILGVAVIAAHCWIFYLIIKD